MGQLIVRDLDQRIVDALKRRAAANGRSAEAEHRLILEQTLAQPRKRSFIEALQAIPDVGKDEDFVRHQDEGDERRVSDRY